MTQDLTPKTIIRRQHDKDNPYFMMAREVAQNRVLSYEAIGLLAYLLSKPDDWKIVVSDLQRDGCGRDKTLRILKALTDAGHLFREVGRDDKGHYVYGDFVVSERPVTENPLPDNPVTENPVTGIQLLENPPLHNTDIQNTECTEKEKEKVPLVESVPAAAIPMPDDPKEKAQVAQRILTAATKHWNGNDTQRLSDEAFQANVQAMLDKYGAAKPT